MSAKSEPRQDTQLMTLSQKAQILPIPNYRKMPELMRFSSVDEPVPSAKQKPRANPDFLAMIQPYQKPLDYYLHKVKGPHKGTVLEGYRRSISVIVNLDLLEHANLNSD
jgi:hypothetical protein